MSQRDEDRTINIRVLTFDGGEDKFEYKLDTLDGTVKTDALAHFKIVPTPGVKYKLAEKKDGNFRILDDNKSLESERIQNNDELWLTTEQKVG